MDDKKPTFQRITIDPEQMNGVPCIRGIRIPVSTVIAMLADGMSESEILEAYPSLEAGDIKEALKFAAATLHDQEIPIVTSA